MVGGYLAAIIHKSLRCRCAMMATNSIAVARPFNLHGLETIKMPTIRGSAIRTNGRFTLRCPYKRVYVEAV